MSTPGLDQVKTIEIPKSKSLLQRGEILFSFLDPKGTDNPSFGEPDLAEDSQNLRNCRLDFFKNKNIFNLGSSATAFRLWAIRLSRTEGHWTLLGNPDLFDRPHQDLLEILNVFGVRAHLQKDRLEIEVSQSQSRRENFPEKITIRPHFTSQVLSGLVLSCWNLPKKTQIQIPKNFPSKSYFEMTLALLSKLGFDLERNSFSNEIEEICIPPDLSLKGIASKLLFKTLNEKDMSAAFFAKLFSFVLEKYSKTKVRVNLTLGEVQESIQPDARAFDVLKKHWGIDLWSGISELRLQTKNEIDVSQNLDLYPVLAAFDSLSPTGIKWLGTQNLAFKESNRLKRTAELLELSKSGGVFDPRPDHRLAMAAAILLAGGRDFKVTHPEVLRKSFPQFEKVFTEIPGVYSC